MAATLSRVKAALRLCFAVLAVAPAGCESDPETAEWAPAFDAEPLGWFMNLGGAAPDALWAVGGRADEGLVMQFDGAAWSQFDVPANVPLLNWEHATATDDVTAVGNGGTVLHFDGGSWIPDDAAA